MTTVYHFTYLRDGEKDEMVIIPDKEKLDLIIAVDPYIVNVSGGDDIVFRFYTNCTFSANLRKLVKLAGIACIMGFGVGLPYFTFE